MSAMPPPPPPLPQQIEEKAPPAAWLVPAAGVLAVVGAVLPWFQPVLTFRGTDYPSEDNIHSWDDGKIGLVGPILLAAIGVSAVLLLLGRNTRFHRGSTSPVVNLARGSLIGGAVGVVTLVIAWFILPSQYDDWDRTLDAAKLRDPNADIGHGPQIGLWLTGAAAIVALIAGVVILVTRQKPAAGAGVAPGYPPPAPQQALPPQGLPPQGYQQPGYQQPGYQQPGYQQPGYQQPGYQQPGYQPPAGPTP